MQGTDQEQGLLGTTHLPLIFSIKMESRVEGLENRRYRKNIQFQVNSRGRF